MAKAAKAVPEGLSTMTPQLVFDDGAKAIEWYTKAFGAEELSRSVGPDGKIMHAEIRIGNSRFYMNDAMMGARSPKAIGGSPASFWLYVENSDELFKRAVAEGAEVQVPFDNQFWGDRGGAIADPEGYTWWIATRVEDLTREEIASRAESFFKAMAPASGQ